MRRKPAFLIALLAVALAAGFASSRGSSARTGAPHYTGFTARVTNAWFPLRPGSVYRYRGIKDGKASREVMTVTHRVRTIEGAKCVVVSDLLYLEGRLGE